MNVLEIPPATSRIVWTQPKKLREVPRVIPMGIINNPKLNVPVAIVEKLTANIVPTITHP